MFAGFSASRSELNGGEATSWSPVGHRS
jgi:hypothetical protein